MSQNAGKTWLWPKKVRYNFVTTAKMSNTRDSIGIQERLRLAKMEVNSNKEHRVASERLERLDVLLKQSCLESQVIDLHWDRCCEEAIAGVEAYRQRAGILAKLRDNRQRMALEAVTALRVNILRHELGVPSIRGLSVLISGSEAYANFCGLLDGYVVKGSSKSRLDRLSRLFSEGQLKELHATLISMLGSAEACAEVGLCEPVAMDTTLIDGTCIEANIHHPADWTLLGDVARTLLLGLERIRERGILNRMPQSPAKLMNAFNKLGIEMTHTRRRKNGKVARKQVLRRMKRLLKTIGEHARRHLVLLRQGWSKAGFFPGECEQLRRRMERMLELLPKVIHQAHERIIGGRKVANADKILSVYEPEVHVLVRGKSGKEIEYGNHCCLAENEAGYIVDWKLYRGIAPGEPEQLRESIRRQWDLLVDDELARAVTDRGLNSKRNTRFLRRNKIADMTCPRNPDALQKHLHNEDFKRLQKRRGSTEARIAILKNSRLGGRIRAKGFTNRSTTLAWAILSHNLWLLSRQIADEIRQREKAA